MTAALGPGAGKGAAKASLRLLDGVIPDPPYPR